MKIYKKDFSIFHFVNVGHYDPIREDHRTHGQRFYYCRCKLFRIGSETIVTELKRIAAKGGRELKLLGNASALSPP